MTKPKVIDLNNYIKVNDNIELEKCGGIILILPGIQEKTYWKSKRKQTKLIDDINDIEWSYQICIETKGTEEDYMKRVKWWFNNALKNDEYKKELNDKFCKDGYDLKDAVNKAILWLSKQNIEGRKSHLNLFIKKWFRNGLSYIRKKKVLKEQR